MEHTDDTTHTLQAIRDAGLVLALNDDQDGIMAGPREALTPEIRQSIAASREGLLRYLLFREAARFFHEHLRAAEALESEAASAGYEALSAAGDKLNDAWLDENLDTFKDALRSWLKSGLRAYSTVQQTEKSGDAQSAAEKPARVVQELQPKLEAS